MTQRNCLLFIFLKVVFDDICRIVVYIVYAQVLFKYIPHIFYNIASENQWRIQREKIPLNSHRRQKKKKLNGKINKMLF